MLDTYLNILVSSLLDCFSFALLSAVPVCNILNIHNLLGFFESSFVLFQFCVINTLLLDISNSLKLQALGLLFLVFASWVAYVIFEDTIQGKTVFTSFSTTLYQMFLLFNTANNPDVWVPAYK